LLNPIGAFIEVFGGGLIERGPVQSSEKLYKAAEEAVKTLTTYFNLRRILEDVERSGGILEGCREDF
jgi:hypothetical protein